MKIPKLTSPQYLVVSLLLEGEMRGRSLREKLSEYGQRSSAPAFYQFMSRLEEAGYVTGRYEQKLIGGQAVKERVYTIAGAGILAQSEFEDFANSIAASRLQGGFVL